VFIIYAATNGYLDDLPVSARGQVREGAVSVHGGQVSDVGHAIAKTGALDEKTEETMKKALDEFKAGFRVEVEGAQMKRSEPAGKWWKQAEHDLDVARDLAAQSHWDTCAHMCQQAVELAIKALWMDAKQVEMAPRTHWVAQMASDLGCSKGCGR